MNNSIQLTEEDQRGHIIEILKEAHSYGLQKEVEEIAISNIKNFSSALEAYEYGYNQCIK
jgi:hypothetical protein